MAIITARDVADYFLASVDAESGDNISNLKLQKLVYYAQGVYLALLGGPLFDDPICVWQHGQVVPDLYRVFKEYGSGAIPPSENFDRSKYSQFTIDVLDEVRSVYGQYSALKLREMTHREPPWRDIALNEIIPIELMRDYFKTQVIDGSK
jgi:uncharacterized phage-associated protein